MAYKAGDYSKNQAIDPASCPTLPVKLGKAVGVGILGYQIGAMTARRASESKVAGFFKELKYMWDVPNPEQRARERRGR